MMIRNLLLTTIITSCTCLASPLLAQEQTQAQEIDATTGATKQEGVSKWANAISRLHIGGYGEVAYSRNFYSNHVSRYTDPKDEHRNDPSHGKFDIPHAVLNIGYDFGKGWSFGMEIEYEHGGTGTAYEKENEEGGEWEQEQEKGGEVELEQFWIQKSFAQWANIRAGHIVVPVGLNNSAHEPMNFFTVYRPEGENTIIPSTWHQTGVSFWGRYKKVRYEAQFLAGLNAMNFTNENWIKKGAASPLEFEPATKYGLALRGDWYATEGVRIGLSGYYGHTIGNSATNDATGVEATYRGAVEVGSLDFTIKRWNWVIRGQIDYGHLGDAEQLAYLADRRDKTSPYHHSKRVSSNAYAFGVEAGYDVFSQIAKLRGKEKLYVFGRYENYDSYASATNGVEYKYLKKQRMALGINYMPLKQIVVKAEYSKRFLRSDYNNEPSFNVGIAWQGWFL